jgi:predicted GNAT superfamily acetyltransferase
MRLRELAAADRPKVLRLHDESVEVLSEMDEERLEFILSLAHRSLVAELDGEVVGFAIAIAQGTGYDSDNYRWFSERYERFLYLDRIAVDATRRRHGLGGALYDAMEAKAAASGRMVCEVNVEPPNEVSLAFHRARGYHEVGRLAHGTVRTVALFSKELQAPGTPIRVRSLCIGGPPVRR